MTSGNYTDLLLGLAIVVCLCSRQLTWRPVVTAKMWRLPLILGVVGLIQLSQLSDRPPVKAADVAILVLSGLLAIVSGVLMGWIARFRPITAAGPGAATVESRTGWLGVGIWIALIGGRILLEVLGHQLNAELATSSGVIFLVIALNRAARTLVFSARLDRHRALVA
jgi:hypothetical protein